MKRKGWSYHTADRMGWFLWNRKKRLKFCRRYLREHGVRFRMYMVKTTFYLIPNHERTIEVILHKRDEP